MKTTLVELWLPILLSAAAVWFWAFLSWAVLPIHKKDSKALPDEEGAIKALRGLNLPSGNYMFPFCHSNDQRKDPTFVEKWKTGPAGQLNVWKPCPNMGANMLQSFLVYLAVSLFIGYIGSAAGLAHGTSFAKLFQVLGSAGLVAYCFSFLPTMIWFQASCNAKYMGLLDGVVSGLATGAIFAALWPH